MASPDSGSLFDPVIATLVFQRLVRSLDSNRPVPHWTLIFGRRASEWELTALLGVPVVCCWRAELQVRFGDARGPGLRDRKCEVVLRARGISCSVAAAVSN